MQLIIHLACWTAAGSVATAFALAWFVCRRAHTLPTPPTVTVIRFEDLRDDF